MKYFLPFLWVSMLMIGLNVQAERSVDSDCFPAVVLKKDLVELYTKLKASHHDLFVNVAESEFDQWFAAIEKEIKPCMNLTETTLLFQKFVAKGKIAHARIELPTHLYGEHQDQGGTFFPLYVRSDGQSMWVSENYSAQPNIRLGDEILAINGITASTWLSRFGNYLSADTDRMLGGFLEFYLGFLLWFELGEQQHFDLLLNQQQQEIKIKVAAITATQRAERQKTAKQPLALGWDRTAKMQSNHVAYLRPGPFFNTDGQAEDVWDNSTFKTFINDAFAQFKREKAQAILIDLRNNPGGDNSFSDLMLARIADQPFKFAAKFKVKVSEAFKAANEQRLSQLPADQQTADRISVQYKKAYAKLKNGDSFEFNLSMNQPHEDALKIPVFMLINRHSYSNAVTVAAMAQDYGFASIIGEETTDLATTYGAMEHFQLTETEIKVGFPKAFIVRPNGDETVRGVVPDIQITTPIFEDQEDPVLKQALSIIQTKLDSDMEKD